MKLLLLLIAAAAFTGARAQHEEIKIPAGVKYSYCDDETNEKARQLIAESLKDSTKYTLLQSPLIVGPQLWSRFRDIKKLADIEGGNVTVHADGAELAGKMAQNMADAKKLWTEFRKEVQGNYIIRKANEAELAYYWAVISFDIEEPLLIVETKERSYILNLLKKDLKLLWLDEAPAGSRYDSAAADNADKAQKDFKMYQNGKEITALTAGKKETGLEKVVFVSSNEEMEANKSLDDIKKIIDKTSEIFDALFKNTTKAGKVMITFELKPGKVDVAFAVRDDIDLSIMKKFEQRIGSQEYPGSKKEPITFQLIYKINSFNDTE